MIELGYDSHNPILTLRTLMSLQIIYFLRLAFLLGVLLPFKELLLWDNVMIFIRK